MSARSRWRTGFGDVVRQSITGSLACLSGVSLHFLSNLENGKPTVEFLKVLLVLRNPGIEMELRTRQSPETHIPYSRFNTGGNLRLSLAGAQDKWPLYYDGNK